ncbi:MAG: ferritin-like domain-containing protein [Acidimicrobiales bacterium]
MDLNRDELRRELRDVDEAHRAAMKPWRQALMRLFGGRERDQLSVMRKAELLGVPVPGRRQFFRFGGATLLGAAVLAACGDDDDDAASTPTTGAGGGATDMDRVLLRTATSLEILAVQTYDTAVGSGLVTTQAVADAAMLFRDQHDEHAEQLKGATEANGGEPYAEPNAFVKANVVDPAVAGLRTENDVVAFAATLENVAAQTYAFAAGALSIPALRQAIMAIGGVEARHAAILRHVLAEAEVPDAFLPTEERIPDEALITS